MTQCVIDGKQCECQPDEGMACSRGTAAEVQAALNAEAMALRKDAERYRWLRHGDNDERGAIQRPGVLTYMLRGGLLDLCCDAGIAADAEQEAHTVEGPGIGAA